MAPSTEDPEAADRAVQREAIFQRTMAIAQETGAGWPADLKNFDYDEWLYDENGLPRS